MPVDEMLLKLIRFAIECSDPEAGGVVADYLAERGHPLADAVRKRSQLWEQQRREFSSDGERLARARSRFHQVLRDCEQEEGQWTRMALGEGMAWRWLCAVWGEPSGKVHIVGDGAWVCGDGKEWTIVNHVPGDYWPCWFLRGVWGNNQGIIWAVGSNGSLLRSDGKGWASFHVQKVPDGQWMAEWAGDVCGVWGDEEEWWAVGSDATVLHFEGTEWSRTTLGQVPTYWTIHGATRECIWAVGDAGAIARRTSEGWSLVSSPTEKELRGVWAPTPDEAWAVGENVIIHYENGAWSANPVRAKLRAVHGSHARDIWAVGRGAVLHWDGNSWQRMRVPGLKRNHELLGVWCSERTVWVVGDERLVLRYDR